MGQHHLEGGETRISVQLSPTGPLQKTCPEGPRGGKYTLGGDGGESSFSDQNIQVMSQPSPPILLGDACFRLARSLCT